MSTGLALQLTASFLTLSGLWLMVRRPLLGACVGQVGNGFWLALNLHYELYGLIPFSLAMLTLQARMMWHWRPERCPMKEWNLHGAAFALAEQTDRAEVEAGKRRIVQAIVNREPCPIRTTSAEATPSARAMSDRDRGGCAT